MDTNEYRKRVLAPFRRGRRVELIAAITELVPRVEIQDIDEASASVEVVP